MYVYICKCACTWISGDGTGREVMAPGSMEAACDTGTPGPAEAAGDMVGCALSGPTVNGVAPERMDATDADVSCMIAGGGTGREAMAPGSMDASCATAVVAPGPVEATVGTAGCTISVDDTGTEATGN